VSSRRHLTSVVDELAQPNDIAEVAIFPASSDSGWLTGEIMLHPAANARHGTQRTGANMIGVSVCGWSFASQTQLTRLEHTAPIDRDLGAADVTRRIG
jgi:hypothetical protein